jgi:hypothetical protein
MAVPLMQNFKPAEVKIRNVSMKLLFPQKNRTLTSEYLTHHRSSNCGSKWKLLPYSYIMVFMWPFLDPCTQHEATQWSGLLGSTWPNRFSKSTCPLCKSWKTIMCYGLCWVEAIVRGKVLLGNLGKHSMVGQNLERSRETSTIYTSIPP